MKNLRLMMLAAVICASVNVTLAQTSPPAQTKAQAQERVYGSQLMTVQERNEYRLRMRELKTQAERVQFRTEHHDRMQDRAKDRGLTLPAAPPIQGQGAGPRGPGGGAVRP